jgi:hypothetical protein
LFFIQGSLDNEKIGALISAEKIINSIKCLNDEAKIALAMAGFR